MTELKLENYFLAFIGILVLCLILSVLMHSPKSKSKPSYGGPFGYKYVDGHCILVKEVPNKKTDVYSYIQDCMAHNSGPFGYKFVDGKCILVKEVPNEKTGVYENVDACMEAHNKSHPFGYKFVDGKCILVNEVPNEKTGVYVDVKQCVDSQNKGHPFGYIFIDNECVLVSEYPNTDKGVYSNEKACMDAHKKNPFGFKCMKGSLGPNVGYCERVDEAPHGKAGDLDTIYADAEECLLNCGIKNSSYACVGLNNKKECVHTYHDVVSDKFYKTVTECNTACNPVK
jgi:hypothetical protein